MRLVSTILVLLLAPCLAIAAPAQPAEEGLVARYLIRRGEQAPEELVVVRTGSLIERHFVQRGTRELWRRDAAGELEHLKLFASAQRGVHYTRGDLRTIGGEPRWDELTEFVSPEAREALAPAGETRAPTGHRARAFRGAIHGRAARLEYVDELALTARLTVGQGKQALRIELVSLSACTPAQCSARVEPSIRVLEFADLGDMEYDPFVRGFLAREQRDHTHALH
jgi:hypothetical protein